LQMKRQKMNSVDCSGLRPKLLLGENVVFVTNDYANIRYRLASGYLVLNWVLYLILNKSNTAYRRYAYVRHLNLCSI
jgi:hypothetical protein